MKIVQIRRMGEMFKAAPNNYNRTQSAFGSYSFSASDLETKIAAAKSKGFEVQIVEQAGRIQRVTAPGDQNVIPMGQIDKERGILKTQTTEYVRDCITTKLVPVERARFIGISRGYPYWITDGDDIAGINTIYPSVFGDMNPKDHPRRFNR